MQRCWEHRSDHKNCELLSASLLSKINVSTLTKAFVFQLFIGHSEVKRFLYKAWKAELHKCACGENEVTVEHFVLQCQKYQLQK